MPSRVLVLGPGCRKCRTLHSHTLEALKSVDTRGEVEVEHVTDPERIAAYGPLLTPALVIDDTVVATGKVLSVAALTNILSEHLR